MPTINDRGITLFPILFIATFLLLMSIGVMQLTQSSQLTERGLASSSDLANGLNEIRMLTNDEPTCAKSGLIGQTVDPANPTATDVKLYLPGTAPTTPIPPPVTPTPSPVVLFEQNGVMGNTRHISFFRFVELVDEGQDQQGGLPTGFERYRATLQVNTDILGRAFAGPKNSQIQMVLALDPGNVVRRCFGVNQCPPGQAVMSVTPEGTLECSAIRAPCEEFPTHNPPVRCVSDWIDATNPAGRTFTHNLATVTNQDLGSVGNPGMPAYADYRVYVEWTRDPGPGDPANIISSLTNLQANFSGGGLTSSGFVVSGWLNKRGNTIDVGPIGTNVTYGAPNLNAYAAMNFTGPARARVRLFPYSFECKNGAKRALGSFACWQLGAPGQGCDTVCGNANGVDWETINFAGTVGNAANCSAVANVFGLGSATTDNSAPMAGLGCTYQGGTTSFATSASTTFVASAPGQQRFCACLQ